MRSIIRQLCVVVVLAVPAAAMAGHRYTFLEGGYLNRDEGKIDDSGLRLAGSGAVTHSVALIGEYADTGDFEQLSAGGIFHAPITRDLDWTAGATLEFADTGLNDDTGWGLRGGLRWRFAQAFELNPEIRYLDVFDDAGVSLRLAGLFSFTPDFAIQAALQGGDDDRFEAGVRYSFAPAGRRR